MLNELERVECGRCGGSGRYSYCQTMTGPFGPHTCFRCKGAGRSLTKRGQVAFDLYVQSLSIPVESVVVGDAVRMRGDGKFATVLEVRPGEVETDGGTIVDGVTVPYDLVIVTTRCRHMGPTGMVRKAQTAEDKKARFEVALEYQSLLTKAGKPAKKTAERAEQIRLILESGEVHQLV